MTAGERAVLDALRAYGPLSVGALAVRTQRSPTHVHRALTRLQAQGRVDLQPLAGVMIARRSEHAA